MRINVMSQKGTSAGVVFSTALRVYLHQSKDSVQTMSGNEPDVGVLVNGSPVDMNLFVQVLNQETDLSRVRRICDSLRDLADRVRGVLDDLPTNGCVEEEIRNSVSDQLNGVDVRDFVDWDEVHSSAANRSEDTVHSARELLDSLDKVLSDV